MKKVFAICVFIFSLMAALQVNAKPGVEETRFYVPFKMCAEFGRPSADGVPSVNTTLTQETPPITNKVPVWLGDNKVFLLKDSICISEHRRYYLFWLSLPPEDNEVIHACFVYDSATQKLYMKGGFGRKVYSLKDEQSPHHTWICSPKYEEYDVRGLENSELLKTLVSQPAKGNLYNVAIGSISPNMFTH